MMISEKKTCCTGIGMVTNNRYYCITHAYSSVTSFNRNNFMHFICIKWTWIFLINQLLWKVACWELSMKSMKRSQKAIDILISTARLQSFQIEHAISLHLFSRKKNIDQILLHCTSRERQISGNLPIQITICLCEWRTCVINIIQFTSDNNFEHFFFQNYSMRQDNFDLVWFCGFIIR